MSVEMVCRYIESLTKGNACSFTKEGLQAGVDAIRKMADELKENWCEHRCGACDNGMHCNVHDCPSNPKYTESQFCQNCALCIDPRNEDNGGPCAGCTCSAEDVT